MKTLIIEKEKKNISKTDIKFIAVACCTCCRPDMLKMALANIRDLELPQDIKVELLIIDNDKNAFAKTVVEEFKKDFPIAIHYFVEETRGLASARNRLLEEAIKLGVSHIAMFDDDGLLDKNWLGSHIKFYNNGSAHVIAGPQYTFFHGDFPNYITQNNIFKSGTTKPSGTKLKTCAANNVFFPVGIMTNSLIWFDKSYVFMGGEDGDFFNRVREAGYKIVFNPGAIAREITDKKRANAAWIISRSYYNGYSGAFLRFKGAKNGKPSPKFLSSFLAKKFHPLPRGEGIYLVKTLIIFIIDCLLLPFSILAGRTLFFNTLGITAKNLGKLAGCIKNRPINHYE